MKVRYGSARHIVGYKPEFGWTQRRARRERSQRPPADVKRMVEMVSEPVDRILVGERGHWIQHHETANDGRVKWAMFDPSGICVGFKWGKTDAEAAIRELIETGSITR